MWPGFGGTLYTRDEFEKHVKSLTIGPWVKFIVLHATGIPDLEQWESYPEHQRLVNLQRYYETQLHWRHGPHLFIGPEHICGFSDLTTRGTHCSCWNDRSIGIEMAGNYNLGHDEFDAGDGARVRDNAVFAMAVLYRHLGLRPDPFAEGAHGLHFHSMCKRDGHSQCPGAHVDRAALVVKIEAEMARQAAPTSPTPPPPIRFGPVSSSIRLGP